MARRRADSGLPMRLTFKHGRYYFVHQGIWTSLSQDRQKAIEQANKLNATITPGWRAPVYEALRIGFAARARDAKGRGIEFAVSETYVIELAQAAKWRCAVTGIRFSLDKPAGKRRAPFAPSIDRIDSALGYLPGNVRVVCLATNFALNEWGDSVMQSLAEGWLKREFARRVVDDRLLVNETR